jgi:hypothetical protein
VPPPRVPPPSPSVPEVHGADAAPRRSAAPPVVGRATELAALSEVVAQAAAGTPAAALLVGEPGIGKTRLLEEVAHQARGAGFAVLTGRCSRDQGAPPMWPWTGVLRDLGRQVPLSELDVDAGPVQRLLADGGDGPDHDPADAARFRTGEAVVRLLAAAAARRPLLVLLDDLHWADASSLRLLTQVPEDLPACRVAVVTTRRTNPPTGALAEAGEVLALVDGAAVPAGVADVVAARVAQLPEATRSLLQSAAVLGRRFDVDLLSAVTRADEEAVLDGLDPALDAGLVVEAGVGVFRFSHALVADAVAQLLPATRRARRHAAAAAALETGRGAAGSERLAETARHWLAAGPASARRAWQAAAAAAEQARRLHGHEGAAALLAAALEALQRDPEATGAARYDLLLRRVDACRWSADRVGLDDAQRAAVRVAEELGEVAPLVQAAGDAVEGLLWMPRAYGTVEQVVVDALHDALRRLPGDDSPLRCRAQLALAAELYYAPGIAEREALAEQGLAIARRLGDPHLLRWACAAASASLWRPANLPRRVELADEALSLALAADDLTAVASARAARTITLQEVGLIDEMWAELAAARALAERLRLPYPLVVLGWLEAPWQALQGHADEAGAALTVLLAKGESAAAACHRTTRWMRWPLLQAVCCRQAGARPRPPCPLRSGEAGSGPHPLPAQEHACSRTGRSDDAGAEPGRRGLLLPRVPPVARRAAVALGLLHPARADRRRRGTDRDGPGGAAAAVRAGLAARRPAARRLDA